MLKRVLLVYSSKPPIIDYLRAAFARSGIEIDYVLADQNTLFDQYVIHRINKLAHNFRIIPKNKDLFEHHPLAHKNYRSTLLQKSIRQFNPDLVFVIRGLGFPTWSLKEAPCKFAWWTEKEERVNEALKELPEFDWYFFMNSSCVETARSAGYNHVSYLAHTVDTNFFRPIPGVEKTFDFCFVGGWTKKRQHFIEAALGISDKAAVYGPDWRKHTWAQEKFRNVLKGNYIDGEPLIELYNKSKIVLNITNWGHGEGMDRSGMTMRIFEIPATGSFLLTDESRELESVVSPGVHVGTFTGIDEFKNKLAYFLSHESERESIAKCGMTHVRANNSYDRLVATVVNTYNNICSTHS